MTLWGGLIQITDSTDIHQEQQQQQEADDCHDDAVLKAIDARQMTADDSIAIKRAIFDAPPPKKKK